MKFSIRDLLLVTVIVALAVGWWVDHWRMPAAPPPIKEAMLEQLLFEHGVRVEFPEPDTMVVTEKEKREERKIPEWRKGG